MDKKRKILPDRFFSGRNFGCVFMSNRTKILDRSNILRKLEMPVLIVGMFLCTFLTNSKTCDYTLTTRNLVWLGMTALLFLSVTARAMKGEKVFSEALIFPFFTGFIIVSALSITKAISPGESVYQVLRLSSLLILMFCIMNTDKDKFIKTMTILGLCLATYGSYVLISGLSNRGTMANKNLFASAILLTMPFALMAWKYRKWRVVCVVSLCLSIFCIFGLATRSVLVAFFVFVIALIGRNWRIFAVWSLRNFVNITACLLLVFCSGIWIYLYHAAHNTNIFRTSSMLERKNLWKLTAKMGYENPLGVGAGNWFIRIPAYNRLIDPIIRKNSFIKAYYRRAHNVFLQTFSETGYLGIILYLSLFGLTLWYSNRIIFAWTLAFMACATFSFPDERPFHSIILMVIFAFAAHGKKFALKKRYIVPASIATMMILSLTAYDFRIRHETEKSLKIMYQLRANRDWAGMAAVTEKRSWLSQYNFSGDPIAYYYGMACLKMGDEPNLPLCVYSNLEKAFDANKEALAANPYHAYSMVNLAACCEKKNMLDESIACYQMASYLYPDYELPKNGLAYVTYRKERNKI